MTRNELHYTMNKIGKFILCLAGLGCLWVAGCGQTEGLPTLEPTPQYFLNIVPTGVISQHDYDESRSSNFWIFRGIAVGIFTKRMNLAESNMEWEIIKDRSNLFIDGEPVSNETLVGGQDGEKGGGLFRLSWAPILTTGIHDAKFQFITDGGDILEYNWQFIIEE